ncbi:velvet factor-domain-containing protein [Gongronella butleri]|nr:velvet factor-domain-containing protein [Gongronella butleri]
MNVPPPLGLSRPSQSDRHYTLRVVQQPVRGRSFGFGERDRRLIDPPPVLQLIPEDGRQITPSESILFVVHCDLVASDSDESRNVVFVPSSLVPTTREQQEGVNVMSLREPKTISNIVGMLTSSAFHLANEHGDQGVYFVFHDLTVRTEGTYRLKFMFIDLAAGEPLTMSTRVQNVVYSDTFTIYSAKKFPGLLESTELSKIFSRQGIKIAIRNDARKARQKQPMDDVAQDTPETMDIEAGASPSPPLPSSDEPESSSAAQASSSTSSSHPRSKRGQDRRLTISHVLSSPER